MLDLLDLLLLRRGVPADDRTLAFRRIDGDPQSKVIYFLPWNTPYGVARQAGFTPLPFLAAYEVPPAFVSSDPELSVQAMLGMVADAEGLLAEKGIPPVEAILVGLSVGSFAAIYLANRLGARLCAVAPSDRADMMLWQSPAARIVKRRALQKGRQLAHYSRAMSGYHPVHNLAGIAPNSLFVIGRKDPFVPTARRASLQRAIEHNAPGATIVKLEAGHFRTLLLSARYQLGMLGLAPPLPRWQQMRDVLELPFSRLRLPAPSGGSQ
jgi:pimeloyl-ACP methyl ester carboxylesterase